MVHFFVLFKIFLYICNNKTFVFKNMKKLFKKFGSLFFFCYNSGIRKYVQNWLIMTQEAYVSFETAKLLKDKGFDAHAIKYGDHMVIHKLFLKK